MNEAHEQQQKIAAQGWRRSDPIRQSARDVRKGYNRDGGTALRLVPNSNRGSEMADEDLKAELERLKTENERLKSQRGRSVSLKVSEKGGVSVYGLGRFPVTLYKEQWAKLLAITDEIRAFIKDHDAELKAKSEP
jgi:hypothetical protein